ncbi:MAG: ABC transporter substrate-binding protein [Acidimicrobiales bacterium]
MDEGRSSIHARSRHRRPLLTLVACGCTALLAAACSSSSGSSSPTAKSSSQSAAPTAAATTVIFETDYLPNGKYVPFVYGQSLGYFKQEGINLQIKYGRGSALTAEAVAAGKADVGLVDSGVTALAVGKGEPITSAGLYLGKNDFAFFVSDSSSIKRISDLRGKQIVDSPGTPESIVAPAVLKLAGLGTDAVKFVSISAALADSSYAHGEGDAIGESVNFAPVFQSTRPSRALPWASVGYRLPGFSFVVSKAELSANADLLARFLTATYKSIAAAADDPGAAVDAYAESQPTLSKALIGSEWTVLIPYLCSGAAVSAKAPLGYQEASDWSAGVSILQQAAGLPKSVTPDSVYTNELFTKDHVSSTACGPKTG